MLKSSILIVAIYISLHDIKFQKISNFSNLILLILLALDPHKTGTRTLVIAILFSALLVFIFKIGMGDFKLWLSMLYTQAELTLTIKFLNMFLFALALTIAWALTARRLKGSIAFAPLLLGPFMALYLGI